jgi:hypothetical protein
MVRILVEGLSSGIELEVSDQMADQKPEPYESGDRHEDLLAHGRPVQRSDPSHRDSLCVEGW